MNQTDVPVLEEITQTRPVCEIFGRCGGCLYQHIPYEEELRLKETRIRKGIADELGLSEEHLEPVVPSPKPYGYRYRLDLSLLKDREGNVSVGFMPEGRFRVLPLKECPIADEAISSFLPTLKKQAQEKLPEHYRIASLVVKTGDDGRVLWGGIGRKSLRLKQEDYLWTEVQGKRIFYSLETFFQPNASILPSVLECLERWIPFDHKKTVFWDLYSGVGLFGTLLANRVRRVIMIEENKASVELARYNRSYHKQRNVQIISQRVEEALPELFRKVKSRHQVALVDPPRKGLSKKALESLVQAKSLQALLYLSCQPDSLFRDLKCFMKNGWEVKRVVPLDFFPKTKHIETLALLTPVKKPSLFIRWKNRLLQ